MTARYLLIAGLLLSLVVGVYALMLTRESDERPVAPVAQVAQAPVSVATAPETAVEPTPAAPQLLVQNPDASDDGILRIDLTGNASFFALFDELGIDNVEERLGKWGMERGYPQLDDQGNPLLDQPYEQYDDDTLRAFAENEDMWAQQILAKRIAHKDPAAAIEWYRKAAINGSVNAMTEMARLYRDVAFSGKSSQAKEALNEAYGGDNGPDSLAVTGYAWTAVAELAGWDPLRGGMTAGFVGAKLTEAQKQEACDLATSLYSGLNGARDERGLGEYNQRPPPVVFDPGTVGGTGCADDRAPRYQSECREVQVSVNGQISRLWTCGE